MVSRFPQRGRRSSGVIEELFHTPSRSGWPSAASGARQALAADALSAAAAGAARAAMLAPIISQTSPFLMTVPSLNTVHVTTNRAGPQAGATAAVDPARRGPCSLGPWRRPPDR